MGQKRILLALVEAMHFIDKQDRGPIEIVAIHSRTLDGLADFLDARQHR